MALKNYLIDGSYSMVDGIQFSKQGRWLRFFLKIYMDETKRVELATKAYEISGNYTYRALGMQRSTPPENPKDGDGYFVPNGASGQDWDRMSHHIAVWDEVQQLWVFWGLGKDVTYYSTDGDYYFVMNYDTLERMKVYPLDDERLWNNWFAPSLVFSSESNLHKQCYAFIKSQPGFENVVNG